MSQYSPKAVFSFEKGLNCQNHSSGLLHRVKKLFPVKFPRTPTPYRYLENLASTCLNLNYGIYNKTESKNVKVTKMLEFIKTCDQHSKSLILVIFSVS